MLISAKEIEGKILDIHTHSVGVALGQLLTGRYPYSQDTFDLSDIVKRNGIDYAVTFPMVHPVYYNIKEARNNKRYIPSGNCDFPFELENKALFNVINNMHIDNLIPFAGISTNAKIEEQIQLLHELDIMYKVYGLKYHAKVERKDVLSSQFERFVLFALEKNIPLLVHTDLSEEANPYKLIELAKRYPSLRVCAAHCAHFQPEFWNELGMHNNLFVDSSPLSRICRDMRCNEQDKLKLQYNEPINVLETLFALASEQMLWGTDTPYYRYIDEDNYVLRYEDEVNIMKNAGIQEKVSMNSCRFLFGE